MKGFNPSNAHRWVPCGGSVELSQPYLAREQEESDGQREGIAAHWVAEQLFAGEAVSIGSPAPNGTVITEEMLDAAEEYVALLPATARLEERVKLDAIAPGMVGYIDALNADESKRFLDIWDFKYGHGLIGEFENWQMLVEAAPYVGADTAIRFHVVQPRCYQAETHRTWELRGEEYLLRYLPNIKAQAARISAGRAKTVTGTHCKNCPAAGSCKALAMTGYDIVDSTMRPSSIDLLPNELAYELKALHAAQDRIKSRLIGLEETASATIKGGGRVPGYTLTPQSGNLEWTSTPETVIAMAKMNAVDVRKPTATITPTQAKKAGMNEALVDSLSTRAPKAAKLTRVNLNQAKKVFKK